MGNQQYNQINKTYKYNGTFVMELINGNIHVIKYTDNVEGSDKKARIIFQDELIFKLDEINVDTQLAKIEIQNTLKYYHAYQESTSYNKWQDKDVATSNSKIIKMLLDSSDKFRTKGLICYTSLTFFNEAEVMGVNFAA
jgi:hypothetical protein